MNQNRMPDLHRCRRLLGATLAAGAGFALLAGCKGNTTSAAVPEHHAGIPPVLVAGFTADDLEKADPLTSDSWKNAAWLAFSPSINHSGMPPTTHGAALYSPAMLYLAAVSSISDESSDATRESVSFFLDTKAEGKELLEIRADPAGNVTCSWMRSNAAARPLEDGTPNMGFPVISTPGVQIKGLWSKVQTSKRGEGEAWSVVVGIPTASLPVPMRVSPAAGISWKVNMMRTIASVRGGRTERMESELSPIYSGAQAVSPYRMAELRFTNP